jgi:hypothetical protein
MFVHPRSPSERTIAVRDGRIAAEAAMRSTEQRRAAIEHFLRVDTTDRDGAKSGVENGQVAYRVVNAPQ